MARQKKRPEIDAQNPFRDEERAEGTEDVVSALSRDKRTQDEEEYVRPDPQQAQQDMELTRAFAQKLPPDKGADMVLGPGAGEAIFGHPGGGTVPGAGAEGIEDLGRIGEKEIGEAIATLTKYKQGKANLENRIVEDELWWELRHWEAIGRGKKQSGDVRVEPTSAWLFNAIVNKHADAMDNYPEPVVLPRERSDEQSAKVLGEVLPVIMETTGFQEVYSSNWYEKLKHGTGIYGVFWDPTKENGLGDISIQELDILKVFWEPGITDIQKSRNLFITELMDIDILEAEYPQYKGRLKGDAVDIKKYVYDDNVDTSDKAVVVDWYYKVRSDQGKDVLHYCKFVGNTVLFATENDPRYAEHGWYDHGRYPVVMDTLYPEKGTPIGFGYVSVCKDPQIYIDNLSGNILENAMMATKKRFFASSSVNVNLDQFMDWNEPIVDVEGEISDNRLKEIEVRPLDGIYVNVLDMKIEEMKETASNRDVNSGGITGGATAASAIVAQQEAGNKVSRDMIQTSYSAHQKICELVIELIRQFYDEIRCFRITGDAAQGGQYSFVDFSNAGMKPQPNGIGMDGQPLVRTPIYDLKIKAQKQNPFSRMEQNELAKELYSMGFFNPERAQEALPTLEMMEFEGVDKVREQVAQGQTLLNMCQQLMAQVQQLTSMVQMGPMGMGMQPMPGEPPDAGAPEEGPAEGERVPSKSPQTRTVQGAKQAQTQARVDSMRKRAQSINGGQ